MVSSVWMISWERGKVKVKVWKAFKFGQAWGELSARSEGRIKVKVKVWKASRVVQADGELSARSRVRGKEKVVWKAFEFVRDCLKVWKIRIMSTSMYVYQRNLVIL